MALTLKNIPSGIPGPTLKTYEELVAMANNEGYPWTNTIAELNNHPSEYYTQLSDDGYLSYNGTSGLYYINNIQYIDANILMGICYNSLLLQWVYGPVPHNSGGDN